MNDQTIEQEIQAKGKTAPRITPADIEANIVSEHYFTADEGVIGGRWYAAESDDQTLDLDNDIPQPLQLLTFCVLVLRNGFTVTGESACASPENFDAEIGRNIARQNAVQKIWPLMGYQLRDQLFWDAALGAEQIWDFEAFVQYGRDHGGNIVGGMPWSFSFHGAPVSHENNDCYLIGVNDGQIRFDRGQLLVKAPDGKLSTRAA